MFFLHRPVYDEAMSTDDPYLACLYGFNDHKNYGNCSKCSQGNYCNIGIVKQSLIETDKCLKIARNIKKSFAKCPEITEKTNEEIREVLHGSKYQKTMQELSDMQLAIARKPPLSEEQIHEILYGKTEP